jgi:hypothetical protein
MSSITNVRITFTGGTDEEINAITDEIVFILLEHGIPVNGMRSWNEPRDDA